MFMLTEVKNPYSYRPTELPVLYEVYDSLNDFGLIENYSNGLELTNKIVGDLSLFKNGFVPSDFNTSAFSNYTM